MAGTSAKKWQPSGFGFETSLVRFKLGPRGVCGKGCGRLCTKLSQQLENPWIPGTWINKSASLDSARSLHWSHGIFWSTYINQMFCFNQNMLDFRKGAYNNKWINKCIYNIMYSPLERPLRNALIEKKVPKPRTSFTDPACQLQGFPKAAAL